MSKTVKECEEYAERARARVDLNLERLQSRLTPKAIADEAVGALRRTDFGKVGEDAIEAVRRNPFPIVLAGAALAMFAIQLGEERMRRKRYAAAGDLRRRPPEPGISPVVAEGSPDYVAPRPVRTADRDMAMDRNGVGQRQASPPRIPAGAKGRHESGFETQSSKRRA